MIPKPPIHLTGAVEHRRWSAPSLRRRIITQDIGRDAAPRPPPHFYMLTRPLHCINSSSIAVESFSIGYRARIEDRTPLVAALSLSLDETIRRDRHARVPARRHLTVRRCMQGDAIVLLFVHPFDDVDLAIVGPILPHRPERGPGPAAPGKVLDVEDEQPAGEISFAFETDRAPTIGRSPRRVHTHVDLVCGCADQPEFFGELAAGEFYKAPGGVIVLFLDAIRQHMRQTGWEDPREDKQ